MDKCQHCEGGTVKTQLVHEFNAELLGAPFPVILIDAVQEKWCTACNTKLETSIPDLDGLLHTVARTRAGVPRKLSGSEVKFLRKAMGCKAKELAEILEMTPENISRVEHGEKPLGSQSEKLLRFYVMTKLIDEKLASTIGKDKLDKIFTMKIRPTWDHNERFELRFVRRCKESVTADCTDGDGYEAIDLAA